MKFNAARDVLLKPLQAVIGVVERRQTMPILSNVLLVVKGNERLRPGQKVTFDGVGASKKDGSGDAKPVRAPSKPLKAG